MSGKERTSGFVSELSFDEYELSPDEDYEYDLARGVDRVDQRSPDEDIATVVITGRHRGKPRKYLKGKISLETETLIVHREEATDLASGWNLDTGEDVLVPTRLVLQSSSIALQDIPISKLSVEALKSNPESDDHLGIATETKRVLKNNQTKRPLSKHLIYQAKRIKKNV